MKYWNKQKDARSRCWFEVSLPAAPSSSTVTPAALKHFIQKMSGPGKFFIQTQEELMQDGYTRKLRCVRKYTIWFENNADAVSFLLSYEANQRVSAASHVIYY